MSHDDDDTPRHLIYHSVVLLSCSIIDRLEIAIVVPMLVTISQAGENLAVHAQRSGAEGWLVIFWRPTANVKYGLNACAASDALLRSATAPHQSLT